MDNKLYNVICWYEDILMGWRGYAALKNVTLEEAKAFVKSKEHYDDVYKIVEVEK